MDVGECGPPECYLPPEAKALGPSVAALAADDLITPADVTLSARPSRHRAIVRRWAAVSRDACRLRAAEYRRQAALMTDQAAATASERQMTLPLGD